MRSLGIILLVLGLVSAVAGFFSGCGSLFSWNGRHPISTTPLADGGPTTQTLVPEPGRRYTLSVQVVFDREGLPKEEGMAHVEAKMPLVVRVKDSAGTSLAETTGWLDPGEPPNVVHGQAVREAEPRPGMPQGAAAKAALPELVVERLVGPFSSASAAPLSIYVDVGADRIGTARITSRRLVVHDDRMPPTIRSSFLIAAAGTVAFLAGLALVVVGWFRRRAQRKQGGIRALKVV